MACGDSRGLCLVLLHQRQMRQQTLPVALDRWGITADWKLRRPWRGRTSGCKPNCRQTCGQIGCHGMPKASGLGIALDQVEEVLNMRGQ